MLTADNKSYLVAEKLVDRFFNVLETKPVAACSALAIICVAVVAYKAFETRP